MDFYKKDKGPSKVSGGDPSTGVAKQATDVGPIQAAPELAGLQNNSKNGTVTAGKSNSFKTSSGLVNMLDVTNGIGQTLQGAAKLTNQLDQTKLGQMNKELAEAQASEAWTNPEDPNYIGEQEKFKVTKGIYDKYGDTFYTDRGRATYEGTVAQNNVAESDYNYMTAMPQVATTAAGMIASGTPEHEVLSWKSEQHDLLKKKYAGDPARVAAIEQAQYADAATGAQAVSATVQQAFEAYSASGAMDKLVRTLPVGIGQEAWMQAVLFDIAKTNPESLGPAMAQSYDPATGEFTGQYAGGLTKRIKKDLGPKYSQFVGHATKQQDNFTNTIMATIPTTTAMESVDMIGRNNVAATGNLNEGIGRMTSMGSDKQTSMGNAERLASVNGFFRNTAQQWMKTDPNLSMGDLEEVIRESINGEGGDTALDFMGVSEKNRPMVRELLEAQALSDLKMAKNTAVRGQNKTNKESLDSGISLTGARTSQALDYTLKQSGIYQMITKPGEKMTFPLTTVLTGDDAVDTKARVATYGTQVREGTAMLWTLGGIKGTSPSESLIKIEEFQALAEAVTRGTKGPEAISAFFGTAMEGTGFSVGGGPNAASMSFSFASDGSPEVANNAMFATALSLLEVDSSGSGDPKSKDFNPDYGTFNPLDNPSSMTAINGILSGQMEVQMRHYDSGAGLSDGAKVAITDAALKTRTMFGATGTPLFMDSVIGAVYADGTNESKVDGVNGAGKLRKAINNVIGGQVGPISPDALEQVFTLIDAAKRNQWTTVAVLSETKKGVTTISMNSDPKVNAAIGGAFNYKADGTPTAGAAYGDSWSSGPAPMLDWLGSWGSDMQSGIDDSQIPAMIDNLGLQEQIRMYEIGVNAGVFTANAMDSGQATLTPAFADAPAGDVAKAMRAGMMSAGVEQLVTRDADGVATGITLVETPEMGTIAPNGQIINKPGATRDFSGNFIDFINNNADGPAERGFFDNFVSKSLSGAGLRGAQGAHANKGEALSTSLRRHAQAAGVSTDEMLKRQADPLWRESLATWAAPANSVFLSPEGSSDRMAYARKIDDTIESFNGRDQDIPMNQQDIREVMNFRDKMSSGKIDGSSDIWKRAQEIAVEGGLDPNNMPMFVISQAVLGTLMESEAVHAINPMSMIPRAGSRQAGDDRGPSGSRDMRYKIDNLKTFSGRGDGYVNIPLFHPTRMANQIPMDTRTMVRRDTGDLRATARQDNADRKALLGSFGVSEDKAQMGMEGSLNLTPAQRKAGGSKPARGNAPNAMIPSNDLSMGTKIPSEEEEVDMWSKLSSFANKTRRA